jgi:hypothetical protein
MRLYSCCCREHPRGCRDSGGDWSIEALLGHHAKPTSIRGLLLPIILTNTPQHSPISTRTMQTTRLLSIRRIPHLRPLRPPNLLFTTTSPLHTLTRTTSRPQLPFLSPLALPSRTLPNQHALHRLRRSITTETYSWVTYQLKLAAYWTVMIWVVVGGFTIGWFVLHQDWLDKLYPSPDDWPYIAKYAWRTAKHEEAQEQGAGMADWAVVGNRYKNVAALLEEGSMLKAYRSPLKQNEQWDKTIPGLDVEDMERKPVSSLSELEKVGFDVKDKSEEWRRGYFETMMGMAKAAEMMEGWVKDTTRKLSFPTEQMIGPSNPYPKPLWPGSPPAPLEENCKPQFDSPRLFYGRILTTKGFSRQQRIKAGLAYAAWLDYKGQSETAERLYRWSLELAIAGVEDEKSTSPRAVVSAAASTFIDAQSGMIPSSAPYTTSNILLATTAYASHIARFGTSPLTSPTTQPYQSNPLQALPHYLSILRARRAAPSAPASQFFPPSTPDYSLSSITSLGRWLRSLPFAAHMPSEPPGEGVEGDKPYVRTAASDCEDAVIMNYIGEILYASTLPSSSTGPGAHGTSTSHRRRRLEALSWTRDAVRIAELNASDKRISGDAKEKCMQCLGAGLENWSKMVGALAEDERKRSSPSRSLSSVAAASETETSLWKPWTWLANSPAADGVHVPVDPASLIEGQLPAVGQPGIAEVEGEWQKEAAMVRMRLREFQEARLMEKLNRHISAKSNWFVV